MKRSIIIILFLLTQASLTGSGKLFSQCTNCRDSQSNHHHASSAIGIKAIASGQAAFASGFEAVASGHRSTSIGNMIHAEGEKSMVFGHNASSLGQSSMVIGNGFGETLPDRLTNTKNNSLMIGFNSIYPTLFIGKSPSRNSTGRVGIGNITEPEAKLHIKVEHGESAGLFIEQQDFRLLNLFLGDLKHGIKSADDVGLIFLSDNNYIFGDGAIGVGTAFPDYDLDVKGSLFAKQLTLYDREFYRENISGWVLRSDEDGNAFWTDPEMLNDDDWLISGNNIYRPDGDVGIGCGETFGYRLAVNGAILAEEVTIKVSEGWPDYVFDEDYELIPVDELDKYLKKERHLPGVPSAASLLQTGLKLGQMESLLLKKIEELTLYIIDQEKKINDLKTRVGSLESDLLTE